MSVTFHSQSLHTATPQITPGHTVVRFLAQQWERIECTHNLPTEWYRIVDDQAIGVPSTDFKTADNVFVSTLQLPAPQLRQTMAVNAYYYFCVPKVRRNHNVTVWELKNWFVSRQANRIAVTEGETMGYSKAKTKKYI